MSIRELIDRNDIISIAALFAMAIFMAIVLVHLATAALWTPDPMAAITVVWNTYREILIAILLTYGIVKKPE